MITGQTILCTDAHVSFKGFAIGQKLEHHPLRSDMKQRVKGGIYHIQHVNSLHRHIKRWIAGRFVGVSTKYLQNYLNWFAVKQKLKRSKNYVGDFAQLGLQIATARAAYQNISKQYKLIYK